MCNMPLPEDDQFRQHFSLTSSWDNFCPALQGARCDVTSFTGFIWENQVIKAQASLFYAKLGKLEAMIGDVFLVKARSVSSSCFPLDRKLRAEIHRLAFMLNQSSRTQGESMMYVKRGKVEHLLHY